MSLMSASIKSISPALLLSQRDMGDAVKGAKNPFFKSNFADLNSVREATIPVLNAHGITVMQITVAGPEGRQFLRTLLLHESGEFIGSDTEIVCAKQNDPQALGSAISYARRYGLQAIVCIGAIDDDGEKAVGRGSAPAQKAPTLAATPAVAPKVEEVAAKPAGKFPRPKKTETKPEGGDLF